MWSVSTDCVMIGNGSVVILLLVYMIVFQN